uniref:G-protein coupled receptors family 1 profile domain-containing protein n=1 Tax=Romanomermis culicivorax TaxID=13658 RepID=A0A915L1Z9_ROMCU
MKDLSDQVSSSCDAQNLFLSNGFLAALWFQVLILGPVALLLNSALVCCLKATKTFNNNCRLLLMFMCAGALGYCITVTFKNGRILFLAYMGDCRSIETTTLSCRLQASAIIFFLFFNGASLLCLSFERLYASLKYKTYDGVSNCYLAILMITLICIVDLVQQTVTLFDVRWDQIIVCDSLMLSTSSTAWKNFAFGGTMQLASLAIFAGTSFWDRRVLKRMLAINHAQHSLKARFQLAKNIELNKALLPLTAVYFLFSVPINVLVAVAISEQVLYSKTKSMTVHAFFIVNGIYYTIHPVLLLKYNQSLNTKFCKLFPLLFNILRNSKTDRKQSPIFKKWKNRIEPVIRDKLEKNSHLIMNVSTIDQLNQNNDESLADDGKKYFDNLQDLWDEAFIVELQKAGNVPKY